MNFHDVIRILADAGPWATDAERAAARSAIDRHEQWHAAGHGSPPEPAAPAPAVPGPPEALELLRQAAAALGMTVQPAPPAAPPDPPR